MVNKNVERAVGQATPIVTSIKKVETVVPGRLPICVLIETEFIRLLFLS
jgi:hypothetical protein